LTVRGQAPIFELSSTGVTVDPDVTTATFSIRSSSTGTWSLTADDENVRFNPSSGTGNRNVTVTFPTNSSNGVATYIVTASIGTSSKTFTITQNPVSFTLSSNAVTLTTPDASSTTFDVNTTSPNTWTVWTEDEGVTLSAAPITRAITASVQGTGKARITVNVPANLEGNTYTIYAECEGFDRQEFTITQPALSLDLSAYDVDVKASATTTSFTVSTNSSSDWTITSANVTSATRSGSDVVVTFPANNTLSTITRTVTVTAGSLEKTFTITQKGLKQVTFYTNDGSAYFPGGRNPVNTRTIEGVKLTFNNSISNRTSTYLEITDNRTFELSSSNGDKITGITITYTDYDHGRSGYRSGNTYLYSSADPSTATGNVYATNSGTTGTWTGEATSVTFTMRNYRSGNSGTGTLQRIAKIEVTIEQ
ncbi:MAG: BACON domain-containing protein, partial [Bacteroidales bacterium]|nr:BACON domain-containing protein [Bacteroidales bacterium]